MLERDPEFWAGVYLTGDLEGAVAAIEPAGFTLAADDESLDRIARAFAWVIDAKSAFTFAHSERMADVTWRLAGHLGLDGRQATRLRRAALLHDIGKLAVPNRILDKPGKLSESEWEAIKAHPRFTFEILDRVPGFRDMAFEASLHHERLDGRGYHRGVEGAELPIGARIMAVADVFDALRADRPYRAGLPLDQVLSMLRADVATAFCGDCVTADGAAGGPWRRGRCDRGIATSGSAINPQSAIRNPQLCGGSPGDRTQDSLLKRQVLYH